MTLPCMRIRTGRFPKMFRVSRPITSRVTPMMASGFAPTPLSPVGYEAIELHRLLIDFRVQAFTVFQPLRWAFGYYAVC